MAKLTERQAQRFASKVQQLKTRMTKRTRKIEEDVANRSYIYPLSNIVFYLNVVSWNFHYLLKTLS